MSRNVDWENPSDDDLRWALEWEQFDVMKRHGYDPDDVREQLENVDSDGDEEDYSTWKVAELREELKSRGQSDEGNKEALAQRLREYDASQG